jgi:tRNA(Ile2) C34 agmatinyltransferase TiaS
MTKTTNSRTVRFSHKLRSASRAAANDRLEAAFRRECAAAEAELQRMLGDGPVPAPRRGEPRCPRCGGELATCSPSGNGSWACDVCGIWGGDE